jgi:hypothetical protein
MTNITEVVAATLKAAERLRPSPGYIDGHDYSEWALHVGRQRTLTHAADLPRHPAPGRGPL